MPREARTIDGAENTTVANVHRLGERHRHPRHWASALNTSRIRAVATFRGAPPSCVYDGLIERRDEDIDKDMDKGLAWLADAVARHRADDPEGLVDAVLTDLLPPGGATDDTSLVIVRQCRFHALGQTSSTSVQRPVYEWRRVAAPGAFALL
ncbi:hypothetical protein ACFVZL_16715 [Streptomyces sp. NPDC058320]|uniref:hypothetical protein n=1 Tax=unclassified Streptomyces TaxID=2593676 RepID=UPI00362E2D8E